MRDFLLKMYAYLKRLPAEQGLHAAVAVALAMLGRDDRLAAYTRLVPGGLAADQLSPSLLDQGTDPAAAVGAAAAMQAQSDGCVVVAPVSSARAGEKDFPALLTLAVERRLPVVFLMECGADFPDDLEAQAVLGEIERIQADGQDAMRLMPALRLGIDKAREGDGPTLIECVCEEAEDGATPILRLADVLITEGYATPEELI